jgi:hypothetical protein
MGYKRGSLLPPRDRSDQREDFLSPLKIQNFNIVDLPPYPTKSLQTLGIEGGGLDLPIYQRVFMIPIIFLCGLANPRSPLVGILVFERISS